MSRTCMRAAHLAPLLLLSGGCSIFGGGPETPAPAVAKPESAPALEGAAEAPRQQEGQALESVQVVLTPAERARLLDQAREDLARIRELMEGVDISALDADEQNKLRTMNQLVGSADEALQGDDPAAAASLARKARLLAEGLVEE